MTGLPAAGPLAILGASGHGRVVADAAERAGYTIAGFIDRDPAAAPWRGYAVLGGDDQVGALVAGATPLVIAVGEPAVRRSVVERLSARFPDLRFAAVVHPGAIVARDVEVRPGAVILAGAIVNTGARIGAHTIVNTGAIVEHDCTLAPFASLGPGATLGGTTTVGEGAIIGLGAGVIHCRTVGEDALVGAGAMVVRDVPPRAVVVGVPARVVRHRDPGDRYLDAPG